MPQATIRLSITNPRGGVESASCEYLRIIELALVGDDVRVDAARSGDRPCRRSQLSPLVIA
jgi:hypothetical protein